MKFKFKVTGLDCPNCAAKLADIISKKEGITTAKINFLTERLTIESELSEDDTLTVARTAAKAFSPDVFVE